MQKVTRLNAHLLLTMEVYGWHMMGSHLVSRWASGPAKGLNPVSPERWAHCLAYTNLVCGPMNLKT